MTMGKRRKPSKLLATKLDKDGLKSRVREWGDIIGVEVNEIHVKPMKRKWASISTNGHRMTLNDELLSKPLDFCDYAIVHELVHVKVPNHGKLFKALMSAHIPDWDKYAQLEENILDRR